MNRAALIVFHGNNSVAGDCTDTEINTVIGVFDFGYTYKALYTVSIY